MHRNRLILFALLAACAAEPPAPAPPCPACPPEKPIRVAVIGDRTGDTDEAAFRSALRAAHRLSPDAVLSVGDLIEGYQADARIARADAEWEALLGTVRRILGPLPLYAAAGNHDVWSPESAALFQRRIGHPVNYAFDLGAARVILFDTSRFLRESEIPDAALDWLWHALRAARDRAVRIVVTHAPLWAIDPGGRYGSPLHDVLIAGQADWVLTGHWHHAMSDDRDGIRYRMIGPTGAVPNRPGHPESGNQRMIGLLVIDGRSADLSLLPADSVLPSDAYPYRLNQIEWAIENRAVRPIGFEIDPRAPSRLGPLRLEVANVSSGPLAATLAFPEEKGGWRVIPASRRIALAPGRRADLRFRFERPAGAPVFPGPRITLPFPWEPGGSYLLDTRIAPTLAVRVPDCRGAPRIDGRLDDREWQSAADIGPLGPTRGPPLPGRTTARAITRGRFLYLAIAADGPVADETRGEEADWLIALVDPDPGDRSYSRITIRPDGTFEHAHVGSDDAGVGAAPPVVAVERGSDRWCAEIALDLGAPGKQAGGGRIGFNLGRGHWSDDVASIAYWQPLLEHDNDSFGALVLGNGPGGYLEGSRQSIRP